VDIVKRYHKSTGFPEKLKEKPFTIYFPDYAIEIFKASRKNSFVIVMENSSKKHMLFQNIKDLLYSFHHNKKLVIKTIFASYCVTGVNGTLSYIENLLPYDNPYTYICFLLVTFQGVK